MSEPDPRTGGFAPDAKKVRQVELLISTLLRVGVGASLTVILIGMALTFAHHPDYLRSKEALERVTGPHSAFPHTLRQVLTGLRQGEGRAVVVVGLLLLIATPVARVAVSIMAFVYERDWVFVVITSIVLALLLLSFYVGAQ
ncbi:MAG: hypothetical protein JWP03_1698 [Phycisphaerales bacterium]|nr:hypothetical protein [Phycisphaerales bacterium]MDB5355510.1 hypothetical protein [Phycisphaerales bacterium]